MECSLKFLDNRKEYYEPGQKLQAEVIVNLSKSEKINKIDCIILGYAKCKWNEDNTTTNGAVVTNRGNENFIKESFELIESPRELKSGQHRFKVSYALSSNLPTSFKCKNGSIKYKVRVILDRPWKLNSIFEFPFTIIRPLNLERERRQLRHPIKKEIFKNFKLDFTPKPLFMSASIPFSGFVPGQSINIQIEINNQSNTHVKGIKISLKKIVLLNSTTPKLRTKQLVLSEAKISTESVCVQTMKSFEENLSIPSLPPNISNCEIIEVSYELRVKAVTSGFSRSPKLIFPITMGTMPLMMWPNSTSCRVSIPPSYEQSQRDYHDRRQSNGSSLSGSSNEENNFNPRYPVFEFDDDENLPGNSSQP